MIVPTPTGSRTEVRERILQDWTYAYDLDGNVEKRSESTRGIDETFEHDALERLTSVRTPRSTTTFGYDAIGNMTYASDRGTITYGERAPDGTLLRPHAVASIGGRSTAYDAVGNLLTYGERTVDYDSNSRAVKIRQAGREKEIQYDAQGQRAHVHGVDSSVWYMDRLFVRRTRDGVVDEEYFVPAPAHLVARVRRSAASPSDVVHFVHDDVLGSTDVVSDAAGAPVSTSAYDPFGARTRSAGPGALDVGFTGHEQDDELGLINMRGRLYDPWLRRFVSADPIVPFPASGQRLNRYSYVLNNPLAYTDPAGLRPVPNAVQSQLAQGEVGGLPLPNNAREAELQRAEGRRAPRARTTSRGEGAAADHAESFAGGGSSTAPPTVGRPPGTRTARCTRTSSTSSTRWEGPSAPSPSFAPSRTRTAAGGQERQHRIRS
jgi:RHS repeat-associated protein